jgi:DNA-binding transcriptional regulator LsrR (DeoR family)
MDPKKVGRDSGEDRRRRIDAAFEAAAKIKEREYNQLKQQGLSGEALKEKLGSISELAKMFYMTRPQELDRLADEKKKQLQDLAAGKKKSGKKSEPSEKTSEKLESGFRNLLQKKEEDLERSRRKVKSESGKEKETKEPESQKRTRDRELPTKEQSSKERMKEHSDAKRFSETVKESRKLSRTKEEFSKEVHRLHFEKSLSQQEVADKLGVNVHTIYRLFKKEDFTPRVSTKKIDLDPQEVKKLYDKGLTQQEVAKTLGVSENTIYRHFKKHNIKPHRIATRDEVDSKEVHRLHFEEQLSRKEVAEKLGVSDRTIGRILHDKGWVANRITQSRVDIDEISRPHFTENLTQKEVAERVDVCEDAIHHHFRKQNREERRSKVDIDEIHRLYFNEKLTQKEVAKIIGVSTQTVSRVFKDQNWETRQFRVDANEIYRLYFIENLTQKEVAERLNVREDTIRYHFRKQNWETRPSRIDADEIYRLYFNENLTQSEIAKRFNVRVGIIRQHFREQNWKTRNYKKDLANYADVSSDEVHRLYFDKKLNQSEVAKILRIPTYIVSKIFEENNWKYRSNRVHTTDEASKQARIENRKNTQMKVVEMREKLFGKKCQICTEERKIAIHRKDGAEHNPDDLWRINILRKVNPEEYAAVCIPCHRGVHWMMSEYGQNWNQIKSQAVMKIQSEPKVKRPLDLPDETVPSSKAHLEIKRGFEGSEEELRRAIFGEECHFCGLHYDKGKRVILHRKDGRPHNNRLITQERYFRTLDPEEWVSLCQKHHRYVHWAMNDLGLEWDNLKEFKKKENGAEGEI